MGDVLCAGRLVSLVLLAYSVLSIHHHLKLRVDSFDVKLVEGGTKNLHNSIQLRALEDDQSETKLKRTKDDTEPKAVIVSERAQGAKKATEENVSEKVHKEIQMLQRDWTANFGHKCLYQYPKREEIRAVFKNMMQNLTNVFTEVDKMIKEGISTMAKKQHKKEMRRAQAGRYSGTSERHDEVLGTSNNNVTDNLRRSSDDNTERGDHLENDPCHEQRKVRQLWRTLMASSLVTMVEAMQHAIEGYVREQMVQPDLELGTKVYVYITNEMNDIKSGQLQLLCDKFNVCNDEEHLKDI